jgi:peptide/nickel transport system substrate-binding protein
MEAEREIARAFLERRISRREMIRMAGQAGVSLPLVAFLVACGGPPAASDAPTSAPAAADDPAAPAATEAPAAAGGAVAGGVLRMSYRQSVADTLNQHISNFTQSRMVARHVLDCLVAVDPATGEIQPWLAESWEVGDEGREYTFFLRQDVTFHDGNPFNAEAVKANFDYTMQPDLKRGFAYGALGGENYAGTEVVDEYTVKVSFNDPYGTFLIYLSDGGLGIDSPAALEEYGDDYGITALVGSGAFKFVELVQNERVVLERNPDYNWGPAIAKHEGPAYLDQLIFQDIAENATRAAALQNGDVQMAQLVESQAADFTTPEVARIILVPKAGTTRMYLMNTSRGPTDDIRVRQAINHATDKEALIQLPAWAGIGRPAVAPLPSNMVPEGDLSRLQPFDYAYDPEQAGQLLDEAGWTMGDDGVRVKDGERLVVDMVCTEASIPQVEPFAGMLSEVGIEMNIRPGDFNFWLDTLAEGDFHITLMSDSGYNSPGLVEEFFRTGAVYNDYGLSDPEIDEAIDIAMRTPDAEERWDALFTAMEKVVQQAVGVMGWEQDYVYGARANVQDPAFNEVGFPYLYDAWLVPEEG